jgi:nuclear GTP-binding protein
VLDHTGAARIVLRDWSTGKFPRYSMPPSVEAQSASVLNPTYAELYVRDEAILAELKTRKDMRKGHGLVRLTPNKIETREVSFNAPWIRVHNNDESEGEDSLQDEEGGVDSDETDGDEDLAAEDGTENSEDDKSLDEEETTALPPSGKRKRSHQASVPVPPSKKVTFAVSTKSQRTQPSTAPAIPAKSAIKKAPKPSVKAKLSALKHSKTPTAISVTKKGRKGTGAESEAYDFGKFF